MHGPLIQPLVVAFTLLAGAAAMALALWLSARRQPEPLREAQMLWARGLVLLPLGWALLELSLLTGVSTWAVPAKALFMAAFVEFLRAVRCMDDDPVPSFWFWIPVLAVALLSVGFVAAHPADPVRTGLLSLLCAVAAASTAQTALGLRRAGASAQASVLATAFGLVAAALFARAGLLYLPQESAPRLWVETPLAHSLLLGTSVLGPAVATLAFVLMGADRLLDRLAHIANRDTLTGAASRHAFLELAEKRFSRARHGHDPMSVIVLDIDRFKAVNDAFGHAGGDSALRAVCAALRSALREQDVLGRLGGEEFAAILPGADLALAEQVAERLRAAVAAVDLELDGRPVPLRISLGVASLERSDDRLHTLMVRADRGLYEAKRGGRDRVGVTA